MTTSRSPAKADKTGLIRFAALAVATGLALSACGMGGEAHRRDADGNVQPTARELDPASTRYSDTMDAAKQGDCSEQVMTRLTCYAYRGHGYEGAQTALGQCFIKRKDEAKGITWLTRAADSGWPGAQMRLANLYLDDESGTNDPAEGGKWAMLYRKNPSLLSLGVQPDKSVTEKMNASLDPTAMADAQTRANKWIAKFWQPDAALDNQTAAACYVAPRRQYQKPEIDIGPNSSDY